MSGHRHPVPPDLALQILHPDPATIFFLSEIERDAHFDPWSPDDLADCFGLEGVVTGVGGPNGLMGFMVMTMAADEGEILTIGVRRQCQGRGAGRLLLEGTLAMAWGRGVRRCFLEVRPSNRRALSLYRSIGFGEVGIRRGYYRPLPGHPREDALVMCLKMEGQQFEIPESSLMT
ncbi:MAG: ribosomal protein S18-alanine N-acetyltransferase [Succinivibrionaceae bacterium]|nr:ribosomal protein S18-alanine N-acetyltransferase [Succinivibrionaceae bacterium]